MSGQFSTLKLFTTSSNVFSANRLITTLVASVHGAVVTHSLIDVNARSIVCIESENLLVWDLRTQSVQLRTPAAHVEQLFYLKQQTLIGKTLSRTDITQHSYRLEVRLCANQLRLNKTISMGAGFCH